MTSPFGIMLEALTCSSNSVIFYYLYIDMAQGWPGRGSGSRSLKAGMVLFYFDEVAPVGTRIVSSIFLVTLHPRASTFSRIALPSFVRSEPGAYLLCYPPFFVVTSRSSAFTVFVHGDRCLSHS